MKNESSGLHAFKVVQESECSSDRLLQESVSKRQIWLFLLLNSTIMSLLVCPWAWKLARTIRDIHRPPQIQNTWMLEARCVKFFGSWVSLSPSCLCHASEGTLDLLRLCCESSNGYWPKLRLCEKGRQAVTLCAGRLLRRSAALVRFVENPYSGLLLRNAEEVRLK